MRFDKLDSHVIASTNGVKVIKFQNHTFFQSADGLIAHFAKTPDALFGCGAGSYASDVAEKLSSYRSASKYLPKYRHRSGLVFRGAFKFDASISFDIYMVDVAVHDTFSILSSIVQNKKKK